MKKNKNEKSTIESKRYKNRDEKQQNSSQSIGGLIPFILCARMDYTNVVAG